MAQLQATAAAYSTVARKAVIVPSRTGTMNSSVSMNAIQSKNRMERADAVFVSLLMGVFSLDVPIDDRYWI